MKCKYLQAHSAGVLGTCFLCTNTKSEFCFDVMWEESCDKCKHFKLRKGSEAEKGPKNNLVKHPSHYCDGRKYEPVKVINDWGLGFNTGNAVKYIARAGRKPGNSRLKDLEKAKQYLEFEIELERNADE